MPHLVSMSLVTYANRPYWTNNWLTLEQNRFVHIIHPLRHAQRNTMQQWRYVAYKCLLYKYAAYTGPKYAPENSY